MRRIIPVFPLILLGLFSGCVEYVPEPKASADYNISRIGQGPNIVRAGENLFRIAGVSGTALLERDNSEMPTRSLTIEISTLLAGDQPPVMFRVLTANDLIITADARIKNAFTIARRANPSKAQTFSETSQILFLRKKNSVTITFKPEFLSRYIPDGGVLTWWPESR